MRYKRCWSSTHHDELADVPTRATVTVPLLLLVHELFFLDYHQVGMQRCKSKNQLDESGAMQTLWDNGWKIRCHPPQITSRVIKFQREAGSLVITVE